MKLHKLKNGLKVVLVPVKGTKTVTILVMFKTGSINETKANNGISHFVEHMFFKGTKKRPTAMAISSELDAIGGEHNAFTSKEYTGYYIKADASKLGVATDILSDMLLNSKFDQEEIDREKGVIMEEVNMYEDNPIMHIEDIFEQCLYGDQPAGWEVLGSKDNIRKFDRATFVDYVKSQYGANTAVVCVAGKVDKKTIKQVEKYFSGMKKVKPRLAPKTKDKQSGPQIKLVDKKTDQSHISLGVRAFKSGDKDEYALKVMAVILGGAMSSRLFINLRERNGLAYYVRTTPELYGDHGLLTTQAGVPNNKIDQAVKIILSEYRILKDELVSDKELKRTKDYITGKTNIHIETSDVNASWYAKRILMDGKAESPEEYLKKIKAVTPKDIQRVAKRIFVNKNLNLAIIGPQRGEGLRKILSL